MKILRIDPVHGVEEANFFEVVWLGHLLSLAKIYIVEFLVSSTNFIEPFLLKWLDILPQYLTSKSVSHHMKIGEHIIPL